NISLSTWPPSGIRTAHAVTQLLTAAQRHARVPPCRLLVSSGWGTACSCTYVRASCPGASDTRVVACSNWLIVPTRIGTPKTSLIACCVVRLDKRYDPVYSATVACTRGP